MEEKAVTKWVTASACQKSLAEFAAAAANKVAIMFDGGVYFGKHTYRMESVEFGRH